MTNECKTLDSEGELIIYVSHNLLISQFRIWSKIAYVDVFVGFDYWKDNNLMT